MRKMRAEGRVAETAQLCFADELGDDTTVEIKDHGLATVNGVPLKNCMFVLSFRVSLISVSALGRCGFRTEFDDGRGTVWDKRTNGIVITATENDNGLYLIDKIVQKPPHPQIGRASCRERV